MDKVRTYSSGIGFGLKQIETYTGRFRDTPPRLREGPSKIFQPISRRAAAATLWKWRHKESRVRNPEFKNHEEWAEAYLAWRTQTAKRINDAPKEYIVVKEQVTVRKKVREL